jgi:hypothetical protein
MFVRVWVEKRKIERGRQEITEYKVCKVMAVSVSLCRSETHIQSTRTHIRVTKIVEVKQWK